MGTGADIVCMVKQLIDEINLPYKGQGICERS